MTTDLLKIVLLLVLMHLSGNALSQQKIGFTIDDNKKSVEIPFEKFSNLIVVPIQINNSLTLKFILDTGAESAILTEKLFADVLGLEYVREIHLIAPGLVDSLKAYVATGVSMKLGGGISGTSLNMLVLDEDYLHLDKNLGDEIYGIIGYDLFSKFVTSIDYDNELITFYNNDKFKKKKAGDELPLPIINTKPFVSLTISQNEQLDTVNLMVDTGASHAILLDINHTHDVELPSKVIPTLLGQGLGGDIHGYLGRIDKAIMGDFGFDKVLVSLPQQGAYTKAIKRGALHGTIGGEILSRFNVTFDYLNEKLYLKKGKNYRDAFDTNMCGLLLGAVGPELDSLIVTGILEDSPAQRAGILKNDHVIQINHMHLSNSTLSEINGLLRKNPGYKLKIVIKRDNKRIKKVISLERLI